MKEKKGNNICLRIRFEDGTRIEKNLNIKWNKANSAKIRTRVEEIHNLLQGGVSVDEAIKRTKDIEKRKGTKKADPKTLLLGWSKYENYKVNQLGDVSQANWDREYGGEPKKIDDVVIRETTKGKTYKSLLEVTSLSNNANSLLINIGARYTAGSRSRQIRVQHIRAYLEWAVSKNSGFLLDKDIWSPPPKGAIAEYVGRKSRKELKDKAKKSTPSLEDDELLALLESIPKGKIHDGWDLCLRLAICNIRKGLIAHAEGVTWEDSTDLAGVSTYEMKQWRAHPQAQSLIDTAMNLNLEESLGTLAVKFFKIQY